MGFLDRMVGDLIGNATGLPARRLVRLVGGRNLLLVGGAALAGALLAEQSGRRSSGPAAGAATVPPPTPPPVAGQGPPPVPGATPPLPPIPGSEHAPSPPPSTASDSDTLRPGLRFALIRATVAAALADGEMDPAEKQAIQARLGEGSLDEDQVRQIHQDLVVPASPRELADMVGDDEEREAVYRVAALVTLADERVTDAEKAWLVRLAQAFGFDEMHRTALEAEVFGS